MYDYDTLINLVGLLLGVLNLEENLTQSDKQEIMDTFSKKTDALINAVNEHLIEQDRKIDQILELLENKKEG